MTELSRWHTWREIHAQPDIWRGFANELAGLPVGPVADCVPHVVLEPNWKKAA